MSRKIDKKCVYCAKEYKSKNKCRNARATHGVCGTCQKAIGLPKCERCGRVCTKLVCEHCRLVKIKCGEKEDGVWYTYHEIKPYTSSYDKEITKTLMWKENPHISSNFWRFYTYSASVSNVDSSYLRIANYVAVKPEYVLPKFRCMRYSVKDGMHINVVEDFDVYAMFLVYNIGKDLVDIILDYWVGNEDIVVI